MRAPYGPQAYRNQLSFIKPHDFLVEHAKFPFPHLGEGQSLNITDVSQLEVALLERVEGWTCSEPLPGSRRHPWGHPFGS